MVVKRVQYNSSVQSQHPLLKFESSTT